MKDLYNNQKAMQSLVPASRTATANGTGVDIEGYKSAMAVIDAGAISGTDPAFTFELQESDDNSTYTAVAAADLQGAEPVVESGSEIHQVGYIGTKRYLRVALKTVGGTSTPTLLCSADIVLGNPDTAPVS